jgi:hypothetical protein
MTRSLSRRLKEKSMRRFVLALVAVLAFSAVADAANFGRRNYNSNGTGGNGVWHKGYGWAGYGWYNVYGDYVGTDGYSAIKAGSRGIGQGPAYSYPANPPYGYGRTSNYGY